MNLRCYFLICLTFVTATLNATAQPEAKVAFDPHDLPVRAVMLIGLPPSALPPFLEFVGHELRSEGVNTLIFQIDYNYAYKSRPEMAAPGAYTEAQIKSLVHACRDAGIKLIPLLNCFGHQSWAGTTHQLLTVHPEFDETPGLYPNNKDIYCRSYCPNHPGVHAVIFDLLAEIQEVFETDAIHVGMDEVFLIGEDTCPRCQGRDKAELFAQEVRTLRDFLATRKTKLWLWGDRLIDGRTTGLGKWEGSYNNTHRAVDLVPKDIVICDWHYDSAVPTPAYFALKGLDVVICSYNKPDVGVAEVDDLFRTRTANRVNPQLASRLLGVMATNWGKSDRFAESYRTAKATGAVANMPSVENFIRVFERVRHLGATPASPVAPKP
ncbi:MAG: family 20 glycosylhydrolase [Opitutus sp.]